MCERRADLTARLPALLLPEVIHGNWDGCGSRSAFARLFMLRHICKVAQDRTVSLKCDVPALFNL